MWTASTVGERQALGPVGLLPNSVSIIDRQARRVYAQYLRQSDGLAKLDRPGGLEALVGRPGRQVALEQGDDRTSVPPRDEEEGSRA